MAYRGLSDEFRLLAACCRWPQSASSVAEIQKLAGGGLDWQHVIGLAKRHRVEGLVHHALTLSDVPVPRQESETLSARAMGIATENLMHAAAAMRLGECLTEAGIAYLFVKGTTLGVLAYNSLSIKHARDIDLLVPPDLAQQAAAVLQRQGYRRAYPTQTMTDQEFVVWMAHCKESAWSNEASTLVELHTGLVDNPDLLVGVDAHSARQNVTVGLGGSLPTLARDELFAYLCVHGATHGWSRLKWLADLAAYVAREPYDVVAAMYDGARQLGAGRSAAQALLLAHRLLALPIAPKLLVELNQDRRNRWLTSVALHAMAASGTRELDDAIFGTVRINASHFLLGHGIRFKVGELGRKLTLPEDRAIVPLPRALKFLYPVMALPLWVWRRYRVGRA